MKLITILILQLATGFFSRGQGLPIEQAIDSLYSTVSPQILVLGENHTKNNTPHYTKVIRHLYQTQGVRTIAWEFPRSFEIQINNFLLDGDEFVFESLKNISVMNKKDHFRLMDSIRLMNLTFAKEDKISVVCFDIETDAVGDVFKGIKRFLQTFESADLAAIDSIMHYYSYYDAEVESALVSMVRILLSDQKKYRGIFGNHFNQFLSIIESSSIESVYTNDASERREEFMTNIMANWIKANEEVKILLICGADHGSLDFEQDWDGMHESMIYNLINDYDISLYSFRTLYYNCRPRILSRFFYNEVEDLEVDLMLAFRRNTSSNYLFFFKGDLEGSEYLRDRYHGVLVKDCQGKKR